MTDCSPSRRGHGPFRLLYLFALSAVIAGCALVRQQETVGEYIDDVSISASIRTLYATDGRVNPVAIHVETLRGVVVLSGFARSEAERSRAEVIAWQRRGVTTVRNLVVVQP